MTASCFPFAPSARLVHQIRQAVGSKTSAPFNDHRLAHLRLPLHLLVPIAPKSIDMGFFCCAYISAIVEVEGLRKCFHVSLEVDHGPEGFAVSFAENETG